MHRLATKRREKNKAPKIFNFAVWYTVKWVKICESAGTCTPQYLACTGTV